MTSNYRKLVKIGGIANSYRFLGPARKDEAGDRWGGIGSIEVEKVQGVRNFEGTNGQTSSLTG